jgi:competence protein ComFC
VESISIKIKKIISLFWEILFPSKCLGCQIKGEILCSDCIIQINRNTEILENETLAIFKYHDPLVKKLIWNLKYYQHPYLGEKIGEILYDEIIDYISDVKTYTLGSPIIVIPVPISKNKLKIRGYNQVEKIALGFCERGERGIFQLKNNIISKKIETIPQARINNRERRLKNIKGSFEIKKPGLILGKTIIVIDDVTTTGGTINEIINILKKNGAKKVIGLALAH